MSWSSRENPPICLLDLVKLSINCEVCARVTTSADANSVHCKTVGFFLKISKEIGKARRKSLTRANLALCFKPRSTPFVWLLARTWIRKNTDCFAVYKFRDPRAEDKTSSTRVSPKYRIVPYGILVRTTQLLTQLTACQFNVLLVLNLHRRLVSKATYAYNL